MSDFLTSLALRTLGTAAVVTPRQPSRFEPASSGRAAAFDQSDTETDSANAEPRASFPIPQAQAANLPHDQSDPAAVRPPDPLSPASPESAPTAPSASGPAAPPATTPASRLSAAPLPREPPAPAPARLPGIHPRERMLAPMTPPRPAHQPDSRRQPADVPPAIHISIGRVDVRAIHRPAPAPPPRHHPDPPPRSLGEYLRPRHD